MSYLVGNVIRFTVVFTPLSGSTSLANITVRLIDPENTVTSLTVVAAGTNTYYADATIADAAASGWWTARWESSSPKISVEESIVIDGSRFPTP